MYFQKVVRQACKDSPGCLVVYRTKSGFEGQGRLDGYGEDGMRLKVRGFTGTPSHKFVRFDALEEILFDEGTIPHSIEDLQEAVEKTG